MFPMSIVLVQKSADGALRLIHDEERSLVSKLGAQSYEASPQVDAERCVVKFAFDGAECAPGLRVHPPRSARDPFRPREDDDIGLVNAAGLSLKIDAEMNFESGLALELKNCMGVWSRLAPDASRRGAECCNAAEWAVHVLIADDGFFAARRFEDEAEYIYFE